MKKQTIVLGLIFAVVSFGTFADKPSDSGILKKSIETGKAKEIKTNIDFFAGELNINQTTNKLAECFYGYQKDYLMPELTYTESGKIGYLNIESEDKKGINIDANKWNLSLNKEIRNDLSIKLKAGEAKIDLEGCNLNSFDYKMTAGESKINLRNSSVPVVKFHIFAGKGMIDLSGEWKNNCVAEIKGGVGEITVIVPYETGVKISVAGVLGEVNIPFFKKDGDNYINDSFEKSKNTIFIYISGGIGQINVKMEK